jgi:REP element-mobilizing transposase RayT
MPGLYQDEFRISTTRLPGWDYSEPGMYFVTICTKGMKCSFGRVLDGKVILSEAGQIVKDEILKTEKIREKIRIDSYIVMPNHVHLIIIIDKVDSVETPRRGVSTEEFKRWKPNCLGSIINQFKGACTRQIRKKLDSSFAWQPRFYDHIIRTETDLQNLREYIHLNPSNWQKNITEIPPLEVRLHAP